MKLLTGIILLQAANAFGADWFIRWEAAKGESSCVIPYKPKRLEALLFQLPEGHPEANDDIRSGLKPERSTTALLGTFKGRKVISAELEVPQTYYSRYFLILAEVEDGQFMPIYIHQFAPAGHGHGKPTFRALESKFMVTVTSNTIGTDPSQTTIRITCDLKSSPKTETADAGDELKLKQAPDSGH